LSAIGVDDEIDGASLAHFVIDSHRGCESPADIIVWEFKVQHALGVGAQAVFKNVSANGERVAIDRPIFLRLSPALLSPADIKPGEPIPRGAGCESLPEGRCGCGSEKDNEARQAQNAADTHGSSFHEYRQE